MGWTLGAIPALLAALGAPIFVALLAGGALTLVLFTPLPWIAIHQTIFGGLDAYALLAVPFFVFAGELMSASGIAQRLIGFVMALIGRAPGALGVSTLGGATLIGSICGSSAAAVAAIGGVMHPKLIEGGYGARRSVGLITASGAIDIVIPPSIAMILYGAAAEQSVERLFIAGIGPGLLIAAMMAAYIMLDAWRARVPTTGGFAWRRLRDAFAEARLALLMPVFVLGGIYLGVFSPTEAGGFACLYALALALWLYRSLSPAQIVAAAARSAMLTARIMIIVAAASVISWLLTVKGAPQGLSAMIAEAGLSHLEFLLVVNALLLGVGCVLDPTSSILVLAPLLTPVAASLGVDPIHFGVIMTVNLAIGMFTPPFGLNIFVAQSVVGAKVADIYRGVLPFVVVQVLALVVITLVPALSLTLPAAMR